jgi:hypothetical protein
VFLAQPLWGTMYNILVGRRLIDLSMGMSRMGFGAMVAVHYQSQVIKKSVSTKILDNYEVEADLVKERVEMCN